MCVCSEQTKATYHQSTCEHLSKYCSRVFTSESHVGMRMGVPQTADRSHKQSWVKKNRSKWHTRSFHPHNTQNHGTNLQRDPSDPELYCAYERQWGLKGGLNVTWLGVKLYKNKTIHQPACSEGICTFQRWIIIKFALKANFPLASTHSKIITKKVSKTKVWQFVSQEDSGWAHFHGALSHWCLPSVLSPDAFRRHGSVMATFPPTRHKLQSSRRRAPQSRRCLQKIGL